MARRRYVKSTVSHRKARTGRSAKAFVDTNRKLAKNQEVLLDLPLEKHPVWKHVSLVWVELLAGRGGGVPNYLFGLAKVNPTSRTSEDLRWLSKIAYRVHYEPTIQSSSKTANSSRKGYDHGSKRKGPATLQEVFADALPGIGRLGKAVR